MRTQYNDHWRYFIRKCLRNIDYLSTEVEDYVLDELSYKIELMNLANGSEFIKAGRICTDIHIV